MATKSRKRWKCLDCKVDCGRIFEHFFIRNDVWFIAHDSPNGMLCVGCLERRLGRQLNPNDFPKVTINDPKYEPKSQRLMNRIYGQNNLTA